MLSTTNTTMLKWIIGSFAVLMAFVGFGSAQTVISDCSDRVSINDDLTGSYVLSGHIDCIYTGNNVMIGSNFPTFQGSVNGNGYTISYAISGTEENMGLFRVLQGATVQNLGLSGTVISTNGQIGGLVGYIQNESTIENIFGTVDVSGEDYVGGVAGTTAANNQSFSGINLQGTVVGGGVGGSSRVGGIIGNFYDIVSIDNTSFSGIISADGDHVGGLIGQGYTGHINNSDFVGSVYGDEQVGGLVGILYEGTITNSSADVTIDGFNIVGGLVGNTLGVSIRDSHAIVDLSISDPSYGFLGGLVGSLDGSILRSYAIGTLSGTISVGGLVGGAGNSTISQSYADVDIYSTADEIGGLIGYVQYSDVHDSYALGNISANGGNYVGGAIGVFNRGNFSNLYAIGSIDGDGDNYGGLIGLDSSDTGTNSFWDIWNSNLDSSDAGSGVGTDEMKFMGTFADAGWFIATGTNQNNGYPYLTWQVNGDLSGSTRQIYNQYSNLLMYMNDNGNTNSGTLTHNYSLQFVNGFLDNNDVVVTLYGPIPDGAATVSSGPAITDYVSGSYIQWSGISLDSSEFMEILVDITLPVEGDYVFTASIASLHYEDPYMDDNAFTSFSLYDITAPTITYTGGDVVNGGTVEPGIIRLEASVFDTHLISGSMYVVIGTSALVGDPWPNDVLWHGGTVPYSTTSIASLSPNLGIGTYYWYAQATDAAGNETKGPVQMFTVVSAPAVSQGGGGGGGPSPDYCIYGDTSGSYYDGSCGDDGMSHAEKVAKRLTKKRANYSEQRIQSTITIISILNDEIQMRDDVSDTLKELLNAVIESLKEYYDYNM